MPKINRQLIAVALISALSVGGCDINPKYPVLEGDDGPSSLSPSNEAFSSTGEGKPKGSTAKEAVEPAQHEQAGPEN